MTVFAFSLRGQPASAESTREAAEIAPGATWAKPLGKVSAGRRYELLVSIPAPADQDNLAVEMTGRDATLRKVLHAGDPDVYLPYRPAKDGDVVLSLKRGEAEAQGPLRVEVAWRDDESDPSDAPDLEAEPNDDWRAANPLILGHTVYGSADDVDDLHGGEDGRSGPDWFRFEVASEEPVLVTFTLDLIDREVSADLRTFRVEGGGPKVYEAGKDPMEIVHDRERVRFSKNLVRTFAKGTYYLRVDANHPSYVLRSLVAEVPPYDDPRGAVEAGLHYILNAGDAWLAQVPREGNRYERSANLHETSLRCTGCHATSFPAEAALAAHRAGYPIHARDGFQHIIDRIADGPAPLYGDAGLDWQRYIATPLEAQGAQGGILIDFERQIGKVETDAVERFAPFLRAAWSTRSTLPDDEINVVPAESKFGLAWRDWRVLTEVGRRTGRAEEAAAAERIASTVTSRAADRQVESLQDRIHRLVAWATIDPQANANKIRREAGALLALQNDDGGWHESDARPGPSSVYATGQLVDALLQAGLKPDHPAIARALRYILAQQQEFGGWFQPETHENFRTPMRETRFAVMALARAFPLSAGRNQGWGNRDDAPPRSPRDGSLAETLDDLEALWEAPEAVRAEVLGTVMMRLNHESPLVRASAATCLGRIGGAEVVDTLAARLGDPSKVVRRAAASALRRLGNRGVGVDAIAAALASPDARVRRSATGLLVHQVQGFDRRRDIAERLIDRAGDEDYLTRFEAARALRRWFYRTSDAALRGRFVAALLGRLAVEVDPLQRTNLAENLYIVMDENLGGGVSLQHNLASLPEPMRGPVLDARRDMERTVLLGPTLDALRTGDSRLREGVLAAFDGSFLRGRGYARQPSNAVDVGNDREFGFLYEPPVEELESAFLPLLHRRVEGAIRGPAIRLASFFKLPARTRSREIQAAFIEALESPDPGVHEPASRVVRDELSLDGVEVDASLIPIIARLIEGSAAARPALIAAAGRHPRLAGRPEVDAAIAGLATRLEASPELLPVLERLGLSDDQAISAVGRAWTTYDAAARAEALRILLGKSAGRDGSKPLLDLLDRAREDPSETVRERAYAAILERASGMDEDASAKVLAALDDASPKIRRLALGWAAQRTSLWDRADVLERLARLLIDPDAGVRSDALDVVRHNRLLIRFPALARRLRSLSGDPALAPRVGALFAAAGIDLATITADAKPGRPTFLDPDAFRREVNPLLYRPGTDGLACADCHGSHTLLRIAPPREGGPTDDDLATNFASVSRVVDLARPEASLLLRKPRSPEGDGRPDREGPTGLSHVGGMRWSGVDDPAYRAVLAWIRESAARP